MTFYAHGPAHIPARRMRGAVLVVGLIFLVLLLMIGVTAFNVATVEERQAGNMRDRVRALEGAEYALRICEADLTGAVVPSFSSAGTGGYYISAPGDLELYQKPGFNWATSPTRSVPDPQFTRKLSCVFERLEGAPIAPSGRSIRAELPQIQGIVYRVTARGEGLSSGTVSIVQSYYQRD
jgi:type IV pilus assembly protein PilX